MPSKAVMRAADFWINYPGYEVLAGEPREVTDEIIRRLTMPSKSKAQERTMRAAAHNPAFAKKVGIPQKVAREFEAADKKKSASKPERKK
jgi:hypothetical protein